MFIQLERAEWLVSEAWFDFLLGILMINQPTSRILEKLMRSPSVLNCQAHACKLCGFFSRIPAPPAQFCQIHDSEVNLDGRFKKIGAWGISPSQIRALIDPLDQYVGSQLALSLYPGSTWILASKAMMLVVQNDKSQLESKILGGKEKEKAGSRVVSRNWWKNFQHIHFPTKHVTYQKQESKAQTT